MNTYRRRHSGFTLVELLVVIGIIVVLMGLLIPVASRAQESARRVKCASNLRQLGQAILSYGSNNDGKFPRTYFNTLDTVGLNGIMPSADGPVGMGRRATNPFRTGAPGVGNIAGAGTDDTTGANNIPASIFLLVRNGLMTPEVLLCPSAVSGGQATPDKFQAGNEQVALSARERSSFSHFSFVQGPANISYSVQVMYPRSGATAGGFSWDTQFPAEGVLAADLNPGLTTDTGSGDPTAADLQIISNPADPNYAEALQKFNSRHHRTLRGAKEGQNVLYGDFHVEFVSSPEAGEYWQPTPNGPKFRDNIYTAMVVAGNAPSGGHVVDNNLNGTSVQMRPQVRYDSVLLPTAH